MTDRAMTGPPAWERRDGDSYYTQPWVTQALVQSYALRGPIWEPAAGRGDMVSTLRSWTKLEVIGTDISMGKKKYDFLNPKGYVPAFGSIVTNPPYRLAEAFARHALKHTGGKVAILVRLDFLASQRRHKLFTEHPPHLILVLSRRPSMPPGWQDAPAKGGMHDFCWIVWDQDDLGQCAAIEWAI